MQSLIHQNCIVDGDSEPIESSPRTEDDEYSSNGKKEGQRNSKFYLKSEGMLYS